MSPFSSRLAVAALVLLLAACRPAPPSWHWERSAGGGDSMQLRRDHDDCFFYVMMTDDRYGGSGDNPGIVTIFDWDEPMVACMAKRGWLFIDHNATPRR